MAKQYQKLESKYRAFIERQRMFFTASASTSGRVNLSPRSTDLLRVIDDSTIAYLDRTGSGNETAAHMRVDGRMTMMLCAFEGPPLILRLYGRGRVIHMASDEYRTTVRSHFDGREPHGARQIIRLDIDLVQSSCGFGVPLFDYKDERHSMDRWAAARTPEELVEYRREHNQVSIDGQPTGLFLKGE